MYILNLHSYVAIHCVEYGDLQIFGGSNSGRLEFRSHDGTWGAVCNKGFDENATLVACRQLGYVNGIHYYEAE